MGNYTDLGTRLQSRNPEPDAPLEGEASLDVEALHKALDDERRARGLTWKAVAADSGVGASTLTRLGQGRRPDVDSFARLIAWAGLDADDFLGAHKRPRVTGVLAELPHALRSDPNLDPQGVATLEAILRAAYDELRSDK